MKNIFVSILAAVLVNGINAEKNTTQVPIQKKENVSDIANVTINIVSSNHVNVTTTLVTIPTVVVNATEANTTRSEKIKTSPAPSITLPPSKLLEIGNVTTKGKLNMKVQINTSSNTSLTKEKVLGTSSSLSTVQNKGKVNATSSLVKTTDSSLITSNNATKTAARIPIALTPTTTIATTTKRATSLPLTDGSEEKEGSIPADPNLEEVEVEKPPLRLGKPEEESSGSNFPVFFLFSILSVVGGYFLYHNKSKVLGFIIEGTGSRKSPRYNRLRNVEEAMPGMRTTKNV